MPPTTGQFWFYFTFPPSTGGGVCIGYLIGGPNDNCQTVSDHFHAVNPTWPTWTSCGGPYPNFAQASYASQLAVHNNPGLCSGKTPPPPPPPPTPIGPPPPPTPTPTPTPPPTPSDTVKAGDSCDRPLYIAMCPPTEPQPPTSQTQCQAPPEQQPTPPEVQPLPPEVQQLEVAQGEVPGQSKVLSLCDRLLTARAAIIQMGSEIIAASCNPKDSWVYGTLWLQNLASFTGSVVQNLPPRYWDEVEAFLSMSEIAGTVRNILSGDALVFTYDRIAARNISAVKQYLEALKDVSLSVTGDSNVGSDGKFSVAPEILGIGAGVTGKVGTSQTASYHIAVKCVVVPSILLCEMLLRYETQTEMPTGEQAVHAWLMGELSEGERNCLLRINGIDPALYDPIIYAQRERMSVDELIEWSRRNNQTFDQTLANVQQIGWADRGEAIARMSLYDELPNQADFLHYLQRNVYDTEYVNDYGLLDGFDERYWANFGAQLSAIGVTYDRAKLDYAAHWIRAAPEQSREFVYRNNPEYYQGENPFTVNDYKRLLTEQDYAPYDVKRFVDTVYRVPALGYIRDMYRQYVIGDDELVVFHQQLGYQKTDSERFLGVDKIVRERQRTSESHGWTTQALAGAFAAGVKDATFVSREMDRLGFSQDEANNLMERSLADLQRTIVSRARSRVLFSVLTQVKQSLTSGIIDTAGAINSIVALGWPYQFAEGWVEVQTSALRVKLVNQSVGRIRSAYLAGEIDLAYAQESLTKLSLVPSYIQQTLLTWELQQTPSRKRRSASQIVNDLSYGMLPTSEALVRLTNLGYPQADQLLYLADAQRKLTEREAKALAAAQRSARGQANELKRLEKEAQSQADRIQSVRRRVASKATLMVWAKNGIIDQTEFVASMEDLNYDPDNIERYWLQACGEKGAQCVTSPAAAKGPPTSSDGSVYTPDELGGIMP